MTIIQYTKFKFRKNHRYIAIHKFQIPIAIQVDFYKFYRLGKLFYNN